jgi:hypothetical protein
MDIEDGTVELLKDLFRCSGVLKRDEVCVGGKAVHNDHDGTVAIGFVKGTGEVNG